MIKLEKVLKMEQDLKESLSLGFFEHGTHDTMDLLIYEAYTSVHLLRMVLEGYEDELREVAEEIMDEFKKRKGGNQ